MLITTNKILPYIPVSYTHLDVYKRQVLAKIQTLMLQADVLALQDPNYIPDSGSGVYIIFLIIRCV